MTRSSLQTIGVHTVMAALVMLSSPAGAATFNYLYIEASEGNSSGGHTAIQFDDDIYHYQHVDSGLIRLFRQEKNDFHFLYRYLQNRPIHLSRIEVSEDTFDLLKDQFTWQFLTQERQFKWLNDLNRERIFIRRLLQKANDGQSITDGDAASVLRLKGVGLFYPEPGHQPQPTESVFSRQQSLNIRRLRQKIEQHYGSDFLHRRREQLESQIQALAPTLWPTINSDLAGEKFPASLYSFTEKYSDTLTALFAIIALINAPPLQADALLQTDPPTFKISVAERRGLRQLRNDLETGLVKAVYSNRPDWGYAVLVNLARYLAIDATLQSGHWFFIDDFADNSEWVKPEQYLEHQAQIRILIRDARMALHRIRQSAQSRQRLSEAEYSQIEMAANRYIELLKSEQHRDFRYTGEKALPSKSIAFPDSPLPNLTNKQLITALSALDNGEKSLFETMKQRYRYDLIGRNCVTELFRTIDQALLAPYRSGDKLSDPNVLVMKESEKRLGGYVEIPYNFIPFVSYRSVLDRYHVTQNRDLESYRGLELAKLKARQNNLIAALRESNVVSSHLYRYNPDDALFVFFTDDNVLLRPLFGAVNTAAGIGQSIYGLFSWPLDSGKNLRSGATGILMSLPELFFFNMRKGSYKYLSFNQLSQTDLPDE
ncbi:hypothetical protein [Methylomicrobium sp. Wu6]|uniref:hypothetical protein n=1 Tax=Methylomicrobium sp. Wu6 TaxID=3107928 RepID=UPI002DD64065|nr:hypothetical protein [Methylomicrobium sp. Wu6]MEC4747285.1 hypothetical protein [Methylomicrobium sp. Wu6]